MAITTIDELLASMQSSFVPERAQGHTATIQYRFSGRETGSCYAIVEGGTLRTAHGEHATPDVTVTSDFDLWLRILAYEEDALMAWQAGKYTITGSMETLMDSDLWFTRRHR